MSNGRRGGTRLNIDEEPSLCQLLGIIDLEGDVRRRPPQCRLEKLPITWTGLQAGEVTVTSAEKQSLVQERRKVVAGERQAKKAEDRVRVLLPLPSDGTSIANDIAMFIALYFPRSRYSRFLQA